MMAGMRAPLPLLLLALSSPAWAQEDFCTDRPGLGTPACTIGARRLAVEVGVIDFEQDRSSGQRSRTVSAGDVLLRYGLSDRSEIQAGWTPYTATAEQGRERRSGVGDVTLAFRRTLSSGEVALAAMPFVTVPTGSNGFGAGDWAAGLIVPASADLPAGFGLAVTGSVEAAVDADRAGRHLAYGAVVGLDLPAPAGFGATVELAARRDRDPLGATTSWLAGLSGTWAPSERLQLDLGAEVGLDRDTPDVALHLGFARRF
jgi:hypothetical protein